MDLLRAAIIAGIIFAAGSTIVGLTMFHEHEMREAAWQKAQDARQEAQDAWNAEHPPETEADARRARAEHLL